MKRTGVLVNLSRPGWCKTNALIDALNDGVIAAAYVSRLGVESAWTRWRAARTANLFFTHNLEANVAGKDRLA